MRTEEENVGGGADAVLVPQSSELPGLCGTCHMSRRIVTARGSTFYYCTRAEADPAYAKYPRLPVLACPGYLRGEGPAAVGRGGGEGKNPEGEGAHRREEAGQPE